MKCLQLARLFASLRETILNNLDFFNNLLEYSYRFATVLIGN